ncbi:TonB-dependent receptor [uncultured Pseudoteredinibacter sp.]|uniref:TonB-dependent receptor domain-containing protein n=1 Tax=uncultured Pseudoteredinibacter sp. TaxID=1641701 RepID=UPI002630CB2E|nr:TonB-dependent receptor [uncultured Pseudoteredinibacter sp.]
MRDQKALINWRLQPRIAVAAITALAAIVPCPLVAQNSEQLISSISQAQREKSFQFNIPAGPLAAAILELARASKINIAIPSHLISDQQSPAVQGKMTIELALQALLSNSNLQLSWQNEQLLLSKKDHIAAEKITATRALPPLGEDHYRPIEEVIVTAQRYRQNLQQVPIALSVIDDVQIDGAEINDLQEIAYRTPGLSISSYSLGQPSIHLRGIGSNDDGAAMDSSVVLFVDDVYIGRISNIDLDILDVQQVEVLRGPQGTLYGKNSIGGAINIRTQQASADKQLRFKLGLGNYNSRQLQLSANGALDELEQWQARLTADHQYRDGWQNNLVRGGEKQMGKIKTRLRGQLRHQFDEQFDADWNLDFSRDDLNSTGRIPVSARVPLNRQDHNGSALPTQLFAELGGNYENATNDLAGYTDRTIWGGSQRLRWQREQWQLSSISAYRQSQFDWLEDSSGLPASATAQTVDLNVTESYREYSQEFRFQWQAREDWRLIAGIYYLRELTRRKETFFFTGAEAVSQQFNITQNLALFGEIEWNIGEKNHISVGARYNYDKKTLNQSALNGNSPAIILQDFEHQQSNSWQDFSPRLTWRHQLQDELMVYGSIAEGIKSGGFQGVPGNIEAAQRVIQPESAWQYEMGLKAQWQNRWRLNLATFVTRYQDLQVVQFRTIDNFGVFETTNATSARLSGIELEAVYSPNSHWSLNGSYAYLHARYDRFLAADGRDYKGSILRQSPEHTANLSANYQRNIDDGLFSGKLNWHLGVQYQGESYREPNNQITIQPAITLLDSKLSWQPNDKPWKLSIWGKNLSDRAYITHLYILGGNDYALYGTPRTFGLSVEATL